MSQKKRNRPPLPQASKQEQRRTEQKKQQQKTRIVLIGTLVLIVIIFGGLFALAAMDTSKGDDVVSFNYSELPRLGSESAPVKIVEFGDFKCPACATFATQIKPQLFDNYINTGQASMYFVNMAFIGPDSATASLAALSVYHQNEEAFWKFYDVIYQNQGDENKEWATADTLVSLAQQAELDIDYDLLRKDIEDQTYYSELQRDVNFANNTGVDSTPTVYVNGVKTDVGSLDEQIAAAAESASAETGSGE